CGKGAWCWPSAWPATTGGSSRRWATPAPWGIPSWPSAKPTDPLCRSWPRWTWWRRPPATPWSAPTPRPSPSSPCSSARWPPSWATPRRPGCNCWPKWKTSKRRTTSRHRGRRAGRARAGAPAHVAGGRAAWARPPPARSQPAGGDHLAVGVEVDGVFAVGVEVAVKGIAPAGKGEDRHRRGHADVDAQHPRLRVAPESPGRRAAAGKDDRAVAVGGPVDEADPFLHVLDPHRGQHGAKDFFPGDAHVGLHVVKDGGPQEEAPRGHRRFAPVVNKVRPLFLAQIDIAF